MKIKIMDYKTAKKDSVEVENTGKISFCKIFFLFYYKFIYEILLDFIYIFKEFRKR